MPQAAEPHPTDVCAVVLAAGEGARLLPLSALQDGVKADDLARSVPKGKVVYCHCAAGRKSLEAADILKNFGYDVRPLKPGYNDLIKAGFESDPN